MNQSYGPATRLVFLLVLTALSFSAVAQNSATIMGRITDDRGRPIEFAFVFVRQQGQGSVSDNKGNYAITLTQGEDILLEISHAAYANISQVITLFAGDTIRMNFTLDILEIEGIEVIENRVRHNTLNPVPIESLKLNPTVQQGIEGALTSQPGVQTSNELSSNYSVRGGSYAENLVYVNDIEIYRPFLVRTGEQEGLSFPNPDMVGNIYFSAGGFDAKYGDGMSSVLDIKYKKPKKFGGSVSAGLLGGSLTLESASKNDRFTQITGLRYKTTSYILGSLDTEGDYQPDFTDAQTYWTYKISEKWQLDFLGNYSRNNYKFVPSTRTTQFGSINEALQFTVYYDGQEITSFETFFGALSTEFNPDPMTRLKFTASAFRTFEDESYDIMGRYSLDELERDFGNDEFGNIVRNRGVGTFLEHARNRLDATVMSFQHMGYKAVDNKYLQWGLTWKVEEINDRLNEWDYLDSAGYSVPINPRNTILLQDVVKGENHLSSNRLMAYIQNSWDWSLGENSTITATVGVRAQYWDYNDETLISPRGTIAWKPDWRKQLNDSTVLTRDVVFRFSTGLYQQAPFYRELRALDGSLNPDMRAQRAIHYVLGADINFRMWNRPFKFIAEAYYKDLDYLVPYEIDNVRLRYYGHNDSYGYAYGLDTKIHGEFIPGIESWANLSFLSTQENLKNDYYYTYYNASGEKIIPGYTADAVATDSTITYPGFIPRPTDQLVYFHMFFQDEMPSIPGFRVHVSTVFGSGLPFGPPGTDRYKDTQRYRAYKRVDIGFSKDLMPKDKTKGLFKRFESAVVSVEVWNLLDINNTLSYSWIRESSGRTYGIPNYLTGRRVNVKLAFSF